MTSGAAIAFCNDIDFADWDTYLEVHRVLREEFGIEAEDSFWLFAPGGSEMALFGGSLRDKGPRHDEILEAASAGRLSILHAGGNFDRISTTAVPVRELFAEGLAYLREHARVPEVWTNHGDEGNRQNIGWPGCSYQEGDDPTSDTFVLDLLQQHGVRYYWTDRLCTNDFVSGRSARDMQPLLREETTRAGLPLRSFVRYRGALPKAPDAQTLHLQLSDQHLDELIERQGVVVLYQHWCVHRDADRRPFTAGRPIFPAEGARSLQRVAQLRDSHALRICNVAELLNECEPLRSAA